MSSNIEEAIAELERMYRELANSRLLNEINRLQAENARLRQIEEKELDAKRQAIT